MKPYLLLALLCCCVACGGPDQQTIDSIAAATTGLTSGAEQLEAGQFAEAKAAWERDSTVLKRHRKITINDEKVDRTYAALRNRYSTYLDDQAEALIAQHMADEATWSTITSLANQVGADEIRIILAERRAAEAEKARVAAEAAARKETMETLPKTVLVRPRYDAGVPKVVREQAAAVITAVTEHCQRRLPGIAVRPINDYVTFGNEANAAAIIDVAMSGSYVTFARRGQGGMMGGLGGTMVPEQLALTVTGLPGRACDLQFTGSCSAEQATPNKVNMFTVDDLAKQQAKELCQALIKQVEQTMPEVDAPALAQQIAAIDVDLNAAPLVCLSIDMKAKKPPRQMGNVTMVGASDHVQLPMGTRTLQHEVLRTLARRMAPARFTTETDTPADLTLHAHGTIYCIDYGRTEGGSLRVINGSLPFALDLSVDVSSKGEAKHDWLGSHHFKAAIDLPDETTRDGGGLEATATDAAQALNAEIAKAVLADGIGG